MAEEYKHTENVVAEKDKAEGVAAVAASSSSATTNANLKPLSEMPTPKPSFLEKILVKGNLDLHFIHFTSVESYIKLADEYGDLIRFGLSRMGENVLVSSAEALQELFESPDMLSRADNPYFGSAYAAMLGYTDGRFGHALVNDDTDYWKRKRWIANENIVPLFPTYAPIFARYAKSMVTTIKGLGHNKKSFDTTISSQMRDLLFDLMGLVTFGEEHWVDSPLRRGFIEGMRVLLDSFTKLIPFQYPYKDNIIARNIEHGLDKHYAVVHDFISDVMQKKRRFGFGNDWMSIMATNKSEGHSLSDDDVKICCVDFVLGATGAGPFLVDYVLYQFEKNQFVPEKVRAELRTVLGARANEDLTAEDLKNLPYLHGVNMEVHRMYPAGGGINARQATKTCPFAGYQLPQGTHLLYNALRIQCDPRYWKEPDTFDPTRWDLTGPKDKAIPAAAWNVYGGGAKGCMGKDFFIPLVSHIIVEFAKNFDVEHKGKEPNYVFTLGTRIDPPLSHHFTVRDPPTA